MSNGRAAASSFGKTRGISFLDINDVAGFDRRRFVCVQDDGVPFRVRCDAASNVCRPEPPRRRRIGA